MKAEEIQKKLEEFVNNLVNEINENEIKAPLTGKIVEKVIRYQNLTKEELYQILDNKNDITNDGFFIMTGCEYSTEKQNSFDLKVTYTPINNSKCGH